MNEGRALRQGILLLFFIPAMASGCFEEKDEGGACVLNYGLECVNETSADLCSGDYQAGTNCDEWLSDGDGACSEDTSCVTAITESFDVDGDPVAWHRCYTGMSKYQCKEFFIDGIWSDSVTCLQQNFDVGCSDGSYYQYDEECTRLGYDVSDDPGGFCIDYDVTGDGDGPLGGAGEFGGDGDSGSGASGAGASSSGDGDGNSGNCVLSDGVWVTESVAEPAFSGYRTRLLVVRNGAPTDWCHFSDNRGLGSQIECVNAELFSFSGNSSSATVNYEDTIDYMDMGGSLDRCDGYVFEFMPFEVEFSGCEELKVDFEDGTSETYTQAGAPADAERYCGF